MNISLILSGGSGVRFGSNMPKQYNLLLNKEVIAYSIDAFTNSTSVDSTIIIANTEYIEHLQYTYNVPCIKGGKTRNDSLKNGLDFIAESYPSCKNVIINEAVRPFLTAHIVDEYLRLLDDYDVVITAQHITDSLGREGESVTNRDEYYLIQAPEAFRFDLLYKHFSAESPITATVQQLPANSKVMKFFDFKHNMKITYPEDLLHAEQMMRHYNTDNTSK